MGGFDELNFSWGGKPYKVRARDRMRCVAQIEQIITFSELRAFVVERRTVPPYTVAWAFGSLLRFCGAKITDQKVLAGIFSDGADDADVVLDILVALLNPLPTSEEEATAPAEGNPSPDAGASPKPYTG